MNTHHRRWLIPLIVAVLAGIAISTLLPQTAAGVSATLIGKSGTFKNLSTATKLPTGQPFTRLSPASWGFGLGQASYFSAMAPNGEIVIGSTPQTDNQYLVTADHMAFGIYSPISGEFRNMGIPTSTGYLTATNPFTTPANIVGGADIADVEPITVDGQAGLVYSSAIPYNAWNLATYGQFPALGFLSLESGEIAPDPNRSFTAIDLQASSALGAQACPTVYPYGMQQTHCRIINEIEVLPASGNIIATQYGPDGTLGETSGRLMVISPDGVVLATYVYPTILDTDGTPLTVAPREVNADPTSTAGDERFSVIFDVTNNGAVRTFPLQEFSYDVNTGSITPTSYPITSGKIHTTYGRARIETARYDSRGNLWAIEAYDNGLGGDMLVYVNYATGRKLSSTCAPSGSWASTQWGAKCTPNKRISMSPTQGLVRSFTEDTATKTMVAVTYNGYLVPVLSTGSGTTITYTKKTAINLAFSKLFDKTTQNLGPRKGVIDPATHTLWLPVVQMMKNQCPVWPCAPMLLDQWLYKVDLNGL